MIDAKTQGHLAFVAAFGLAVLFLAFALTFPDLAVIDIACLSTDARCDEPPPSGRDAILLLKNLVMVVVAFSPAAMLIRARESSVGRHGVVAGMLRWTAAVFAIGGAAMVFGTVFPVMTDNLSRTQLSWLTFENGGFARIDVRWFGLCLLVFGAGLGPAAGAIYALAIRFATRIRWRAGPPAINNI